MRHPTRTRAAPVVVVLFLAAAAIASGGCGVNRKLRVTEVQPNAVELYLDEPANNRLDLTGMKLKWHVKDPATPPQTGELDLGVGGTLGGGRFLVVFEDQNYTGAPVAQNFQPSIPGIKVRDGFFLGYGNTPTVSVGVGGNHYRTLFLFRDRVNDVVRFGPIPRAEPFGAFQPDGSLASAKPSGNRSISREFTGSGPVDTDSESDWTVQFASPGTPTP